MTSVCLYFKIHQPIQLKDFQAGDTDVTQSYENVQANQAVLDLVANKCYLPANEILYQLIIKHKGKFNISFSISGTIIELLKQYRPDVLDSFKKLMATGCVEILAETYHNSLSSLYSKKEFKRQIEKHAELVNEVFNTEPAVFTNTELIYNNDLARFISGLGFKGILCEGSENILKGRTPNQIYAAPENSDFGILLRNKSLCDDIAFRFDDTGWSEFPLTAGKYAAWLHAHPENSNVINLFMDYETFGIHKKKESGIFDFLYAFPTAVLANDKFQFSTPSKVIEDYFPVGIYNAEKTISWEDSTDMKSYWFKNTKVKNLLKKIYSMENLVTSSDCNQSIDTWAQLQSVDHFRKITAEEIENDPVNPENTFSVSNETFRNYNNILVDLEISLIKKNINTRKKRTGLSLPAFILY
jgi:alpha-amylase